MDRSLSMLLTCISIHNSPQFIQCGSLYCILWTKSHLQNFCHSVSAIAPSSMTLFLVAMHGALLGTNSFYSIV